MNIKKMPERLLSGLLQDRIDEWGEPLKFFTVEVSNIFKEEK